MNKQISSSVVATGSQEKVGENGKGLVAELIDELERRFSSQVLREIPTDLQVEGNTSRSPVSDDPWSWWKL